MSRCFILMMVTLVLALACPVLACKYAIRDVGFVSLDDRPYEVKITLPKHVDDQEVQALRNIMRHLERDTNLRSQISIAPDATGITLDFIAPQGQTLRREVGERVSAELITAQVLSFLKDPLTEALADRLITSFAAVLIVEGTDKTANQKLRDSVEEAIRRVDLNMQRFDKPVAVGPFVMRVTPEQAASSTLLWSLGFAPGGQHADAQPAAVVMFGKVRRLGPVMSGEATPGEIYQRLALAGQSCECELDTTWVYGEPAPIIWDATRRQHTFESLLFDPEDPLVRAEISHILMQNANRHQGGEVAARVAGVDDVLFGYSEITLETGTGQNSVELPATTETESGNAVAASHANTTLPAKSSRVVASNVEPSGKRSVLWVTIGIFVAISLGGGLWVLMVRRQKEMA